MNYEIPKKFNLLGHEFKVEFVNGLYEKEDRYGDADIEKKLIRLQPKGTVTRTEVGKDGKSISDTVTITEEDVIETFFHELTHIILESIGETKLSGNEKFVLIFGKCLLEVEKTKQY